MDNEALIVAIGNPLRGDDGAAHRVAALLEGDSTVRALLIGCHQLTPELADSIGHAKRLIFVDAARGEKPGSVHWRSLSIPDDAADAVPATTHHASPIGLLALTQVLFGRTPPAYLVTIAGDQFTYGETLSCAVERAVPRAAALVQTLIDGDIPCMK